MAPIRHVQKRDGSLVTFEQNKITEAIWKAAQSVGGTDRATAKKISNQVNTVLEVFFKDDSPAPNVEQIQDLVEKILIENGHAKTAKAYIIYRQEHQKLRDKREKILEVERLKLSTVDGENKHLGDFIVLDIDDDLEAIFEGMKETVIIHQNGEKACVNFSALRPNGESVKNKHQASGPIAFMKLYEAALNTVNKNGEKGLHVMLLNVHHPNIQEFLDYEAQNGLGSPDRAKLENFTLMVEVTENFMNAYNAKTDYELINPVNGKVVKTVSAVQIFEQLLKNSQENTGPKPIVIEYPAEKMRKSTHSSIQVNLPFEEDGANHQAVGPGSAPQNKSREKHLAQEVALPPIQTLA